MKLHKLPTPPQIIIFPQTSPQEEIKKIPQVEKNSPNLIEKNMFDGNGCDFLSAITHELKTPLSAIIGFTDLLKNEIHNPSSREECLNYISEIADAADDLNELIHDILDIGQTSHQSSLGSFSIDLSNKIDLSEIIKKVIRLNYNYALSRNISLKFEDLKNLKPIHLDAKRMKQVLMNLISNAIKYSKSGREVRVVCEILFTPQEPTPEYLKISVIDQGFGMTAEQIKIAFKKYGTIANENSNQVDSLGLGLPITKHLVELQNGVIEVNSTPGIGTEISVIFPYQM